MAESKNKHGLMQGISFRKDSNTYRVRINQNGKTILVGQRKIYSEAVELLEKTRAKQNDELRTRLRQDPEGRILPEGMTWIQKDKAYEIKLRLGGGKQVVIGHSRSFAKAMMLLRAGLDAIELHTIVD